MKTLMGLLLVSILVLWIELSPASSEKTPVRPGRCPPFILVECFEPQQDECKNDAQCPWPKKCCYVPCAFRCVYPVKKLN